MPDGGVADDARLRGDRDFGDGLPITRCPFNSGKDRRAWVAGWYAAREKAK